MGKNTSIFIDKSWCQNVQIDAASYIPMSIFTK